MRKSIILVTVFAFVLGVAGAQEKPPVTGEDELVKQKGQFQAVWVHPGFDISSYSKLYLWDSVYQFRDVGDKEKSALTTENLRGTEDAYVISEESKKKFSETVDKVLIKELERSKQFKLVNEVGPDTLFLRSAVLDIVSKVPPSYQGYNAIHLSSVGEATLVCELIDAETGVIQVRIAERQAIRPPNQGFGASATATNAATVWTDVERWAFDAAAGLRKALDKAKKKAK